MKTKYLISALIAGAMGSGAALAQTVDASSDTAYQGNQTQMQTVPNHWRAMPDDVGTGEGYTARQLHEAGQGGSADENPRVLTQEELRDTPPTAINAGKVSIGDGTARP